MPDLDPWLTTRGQALPRIAWIASAVDEAAARFEEMPDPSRDGGSKRATSLIYAAASAGAGPRTRGSASAIAPAPRPTASEPRYIHVYAWKWS